MKSRNEWFFEGESPKLEFRESANVAVLGDDSAGEVGCLHPITASIVAQESF